MSAQGQINRRIADFLLLQMECQGVTGLLQREGGGREVQTGRGQPVCLFVCVCVDGVCACT